MKPESTLLFDTRTKAVMAQTQVQDGVKEKVQSVREVVPDRSNNDIILVLQYYEYDVERTIQAFLEDGAKEALQDWKSMSTNKPSNKKKRKTKKTGQQSSDVASEITGVNISVSQQNGHDTMQQKESEPDSGLVQPNEQLIACTTETLANLNIKSNEQTAIQPLPQRTSSKKLQGQINQKLDEHRSVNRDRRTTSPAKRNDSSAMKDKSKSEHLQHSSKQTNISRTEPKHLDVGRKDGGKGFVPKIVTDDTVVTDSAKGQNKNQSMKSRLGQASRSRENSRPKDLPGTSHSHAQTDHYRDSHHSSSSTGAKRRPHAGLEKSIKDLARQTSSLQRLTLVQSNEMDRSFKKVKQVFDEAKQELSQREVEMVQQLEIAKEQGNEILSQRKEKASDLRMRVDRAQTMNEEQIQELRADIKLFVTDRKLDEDVAHTTRFLYDSDHLTQVITNFGEVVPVNCCYNTRRPSVSSVASSSFSHDDLMSPKPLLTSTSPISQSSSHFGSGPFPTTAVKNINNSSSSAVTVLRQTYSANQFSNEELADLQKRLQNSLKNKRQGSPQRRPGGNFGKYKASGSSGPKQDSAQQQQQPQLSKNDDSPNKSRTARRRQRKREVEKEMNQTISVDPKAANKIDTDISKSKKPSLSQPNKDSLIVEKSRPRPRSPNKRLHGRNQESGNGIKASITPEVKRVEDPAAYANKPSVAGDVPPADSNIEEVNRSQIRSPKRQNPKKQLKISKSNDLPVSNGIAPDSPKDANMNSTKTLITETKTDPQPQRMKRERAPRTHQHNTDEDAVNTNGDGSDIKSSAGVLMNGDINQKVNGIDVPEV